MAKKKINIKSVSTDVESGDVNISYKNVRIAGLSETTTAVLETEDTICEDDIEVEYTKPATPSLPPNYVNIRLTNQSNRSSDNFNVTGGVGFIHDNGQIYYYGDNTLVLDALITDIPVFITSGKIDGEYVYLVGLNIYDPSNPTTDSLTFTVSDGEIIYNGDYYEWFMQIADYPSIPTTITITFTDKAANN